MNVHKEPYQECLPPFRDLSVEAKLKAFIQFFKKMFNVVAFIKEKYLSNQGKNRHLFHFRNVTEVKSENK